MFLIFLPNFSTVSYRAVSYKMKLRVHYLFSTIKNAWNSNYLEKQIAEWKCLR